MTTYARIVNGLMVERFDPVYDADGNEIPISDRFHPLLIAQLVEIDPNNPPPTEEPQITVPYNWRPDAMTALNKMRDAYMGILTAMYTDYKELGQNDNATTVFNAKQALKTIETSQLIQSVYLDPNGTRADFDAAVKNTWLAVVASAPLGIRKDFIIYGGNTL